MSKYSASPRAIRLNTSKQYALAFIKVRTIVSAFGLIVLYQGLLPEFSFIFRPTQNFFWISDERNGELFAYYLFHALADFLC